MGKKVIVYHFDGEFAEYKLLDIPQESSLNEVLNPESAFLFCDPNTYKAYVWIGEQTTTRIEHLAIQQAPIIRETQDVAMKIYTIYDGKEPISFKFLIGLVETFEEKVTPQRPRKFQAMIYLGKASVYLTVEHGIFSFHL